LIYSLASKYEGGRSVRWAVHWARSPLLKAGLALVRFRECHKRRSCRVRWAAVPGQKTVPSVCLGRCPYFISFRKYPTKIGGGWNLEALFRGGGGCEGVDGRGVISLNCLEKKAPASQSTLRGWKV
jgi:hypothetical protein